MVPTPVFLPGESHGQRTMVGYSPRGHKESDKPEQLTHTGVIYIGGPVVCDNSVIFRAGWRYLGVGVQRAGVPHCRVGMHV